MLPFYELWKKQKTSLFFCSSTIRINNSKGSFLKLLDNIDVNGGNLRIPTTLKPFICKAHERPKSKPDQNGGKILLACGLLGETSTQADTMQLQQNKNLEVESLRIFLCQPKSCS